MLDREREEVKKDKSMRREDFVKIDLGNGVVVAEQDCWLEQGKGLKYAGINQDALLYEFSPEKQLQTKDKKYHVYIGDVQIGEGHKNSENSGEFNQYVRPYTYKDAVLWTEDNNLVQYFLNKKFDGLNFALGNIFANENVKRAMEEEKCGYMGGVTISAEGECKKSEKETPEAVKEVVEEYLTQRENRNEDKIIKFNGR